MADLLPPFHLIEAPSSSTAAPVPLGVGSRARTRRLLWKISFLSVALAALGGGVPGDEAQLRPGSFADLANWEQGEDGGFSGPWVTSVCSVVGGGSEKFVDPSHPSASDNNPGTATAPWRTLAKAATSAVAGDTVWVRKGTYTEGLYIRVSGTEGQRIIFAAYPGDSVVLRSRGVEARGQSHIEIRGFRIEECMGGSGDTRGIVVRGIVNGPTVRDIVIAHNHIVHTNGSAISIWGVAWGKDPGDFRRIIGVLVEQNTIERANDGGFNEQITVANGVQGFEIRYNLLRNGGSGRNGGEGIDVKEGCAYGLIHHNVVHDIQRRAYYIDGGGRNPNYKSPTHDIHVYANIAYNVVNGLALMSEGGEDVYNIRIYNNLFYNIRDDCAFVFDHPNAEDDPGRFGNVAFVNNTFWDCGGMGLDLNSHQMVIGIEVRNNILKSYRDRYNLASESSNVIGGDPRFVDEVGDNFYLGAGSPAIDSGTSQGAPAEDLDGTARPYGTKFDVGAYEFSKKVRLYADVQEVSLTTGGTQRLTLAAGQAYSWKSYWTLGSVTGTTPGLRAGPPSRPVHIPLNPDVWTNYTIMLPNTTVLTQTKGTLDATGRASAYLNIPMFNLPSAIGLVFHHAYVVYDQSMNLYMASNAVPLKLVK